MGIKLLNRIREFRNLAGLTQTELGSLVGISKNAVSCLERGEFEPRLSVGFRLSLVLNCPIDILFYFEKN